MSVGQAENPEPRTLIEAGWALQTAWFQLWASVLGSLGLAAQARALGEKAINAEVERWKAREGTGE